jgi:hypothetical protein
VEEENEEIKLVIMSEKSDADAQIINDLDLEFAAFFVQISSNNRPRTNQIILGQPSESWGDLR